MKKHNNRIIISAGGTGGHIFPALAVARAIRDIDPNAEILFVGAKGRMEMEKIPQAGFPIIGLNISGIQRRLTLKNLLIPFKILSSLRNAGKILKDFKPHVAAGFGGYASGPVLRKAASYGIASVLQEQNSFPGLTNRILAKKAHKIFVAYENMEKYFDPAKIVFSGNPVRKEFINMKVNRDEAAAFFGLKPEKFTILVVGGSLGAKTINETICDMLPEFKEHDYQLIWQTGKNYIVQLCEKFNNERDNNVVVKEFIKEMDMAYSAADLVISRAGAIAISELQNVGKAAIFIPSPNVSDDHQTKNAMALVNKNAAYMIPDIDAAEKLSVQLFELAENKSKQEELSKNIKLMAYPNAAKIIAESIMEMVEKKRARNGSK